MTTGNQTRTAHLTGRWFTLTHAVCMAFYALALSGWLIAIPLRWIELTHPTSTMEANLDALGWSVMGFAIYSMTFEIAFALAFLSVAALIWLRRSDEVMAVLAAVMLVAFGLGNQTLTPTITALKPFPVGSFIFACYGFVAWGTFTQFPFLFPTGTHVPRWTWFPSALWLVLIFPWNFAAGTPLDPVNWPTFLWVIFFPVLYISWIVAQIVRYRRYSTPLERQQTKWGMFAVAMIVLGYVIVFGISYATSFDALLSLFSSEPQTPQALFWLNVIRLVLGLTFLLLPIGLGFSILRYRLWDIDVIIRRTLIYGALTALLVLLFFAGVTALQQLFVRLTGQQSDIALVVSTLAIAAIALPLRNRIQSLIDRRFYRRKFDAQQALAAFSARLQLQDEADVNGIAREVDTVMRQTVQPRSVQVFLAQSADKPAPGNPG